MAKNLGINIKIGADTKKFSTDMQNAARDMKKMGQKMQSIGSSMTRAITLPLGLIGGAMIKFASDTEESLNKVDVAFGESSDKVKEFASTSLRAFGIARGSALDMAATFGDMATSMGINQSAAADMSTKLVGLAGDLSSFKNIRIDVAKTALNSIFTGETESLKQLGIVMTQANLSAFALEQGITKPIKAMSEGEKTMLRYNFVLAKTVNAHGDFERTGGGAANQMRIFQEGLKEVAEKFGALILPAFTKVVSKLNELVTWFSGLDSSIKRIILIVAGFAAAIGPVLLVVGKLNLVIASAIPLLGKLGIVITGSLWPLAAWAAAIGVVYLAIKQLLPKTAQLTDEQKRAAASAKELSEMEQKAAVQAEAERVKLERLNNVIKDNSIRLETRKSAIADLRSVIPTYLKGISDEELLTRGATAQINEYVKALKGKALALGYQEQIQKKANRLAELEIQKAQPEIDITPTFKIDQYGNKIVDEQAAEMAKSARETMSKRINTEIIELNKEIDQLITLQDKYKNVAASPLDLSSTFDTGGQQTAFKGLNFDSLKAKTNIESVTKAFEDLKPALVDAKYSMDDLLATDRMVAFRDSMINAANQLRNGLVNLGTEAVEGVFFAMGQAAAGVEGAFKDFGKATLQSVASFMGDFGKLLIAGAIASEAMQKTLFTNPMVALGAGVALVAAAGLIKGLSGQNPTTYNGGVGDISSPPLSGGYSGYGTNNSSGIITLESVVYGNDILLSSNRASNTTLRTRKK